MTLQPKEWTLALAAYVTIATIAFIAIHHLSPGREDLALIMAALTACQVISFFLSRRSVRAEVGLKSLVGAVLATWAVVFALISDTIAPWIQLQLLLILYAGGSFFCPFLILNVVYDAQRKPKS